MTYEEMVLKLKNIPNVKRRKAPVYMILDRDNQHIRIAGTPLFSTRHEAEKHAYTLGDSAYVHMKAFDYEDWRFTDMYGSHDNEFFKLITPTPSWLR